METKLTGISIGMLIAAVKRFTTEGAAMYGDTSDSCV